MSLASDFIVGLRQVRKRPGSAILAVVAYAVGLGMVGLMLTIIFGVVRGHPEGIDFDKIQNVQWDPSTNHLWKSGAQQSQMRYRDFRELHEKQDVFEALTASRGGTFNIVVDDYPERFSGSYVTSEYFDALTIKPQIGRFFAEGDDSPSSEPKAVLSDYVWKNELKASDNIVGSYLTINGKPTLIIGVAEPDVDFPSQNDIWVNETLNPLEMDRAEGDLYFTFGLLKEGQTPASATVALNTLATQMAEAYPETNTGYIAVELLPLSSVFIGDNITRMFYLMFACSLLVLFIACTNVANLTLSRATTRVKELAIRASLGGSRSRLVNQMVVEGFSIAIIGGLGGLIIAIWSSKAIWSWIKGSDQANPPAWMSMDVDVKVIFALSLITLLASIVASIVPALKASRADVNEILKDNSRGSSGIKLGFFSKLLAFFQLCVSCGLLIATSAMVTTAKDAAIFEPPYDPAGMMVARFELPDIYTQGEASQNFLGRLQDRLESNPALEGVGFTTSLDMVFNWNSRWQIQGREMASKDDYPEGRHEIVSDNYFELLGIPVIEGRAFTSIDAGENAQQVCIVNTIFAEEMWPGESPLGKQIRDTWQDNNPWLTVVGVVPDTKMAGPGPRGDDELGGVYRPLSTNVQNSLSIFAKTNGNPTVQAQAIREVLQAEAPNTAIYRVKTVEQAIEDANFGPLFFRNIFALFGVSALALASIGVYGVMDFSVRQRFQEFGIRQALGAGNSRIIGHVFRLGVTQISVGIVLGTALGWALTAIIGQALGGISIGVLNYLVPIAVITGIAAIALFSPAREITNANLANCLRDE